MNSISKWITYIVFAIAVSGMLVSTSSAADKADYVFKNGAVYTIDSKNPRAQAIAITGKHISYVGTNEGVQAFVGPKSQVIDLKGQMLLPGFVESHIHPTLAQMAAGANLQYESVEQVLASLKKWGRRSP